MVIKFTGINLDLVVRLFTSQSGRKARDILKLPYPLVVCVRVEAVVEVELVLFDVLG